MCLSQIAKLHECKGLPDLADSAVTRESFTSTTRTGLIQRRQCAYPDFVTLQLQLDPAREAALKEKATERGVSPEQYVRGLVDEAVGTPYKPKASPEEMRAWLDSLAERAKDLPHLPTSAFSRESFYERD